MISDAYSNDKKLCGNEIQENIISNANEKNLILSIDFHSNHYVSNIPAKSGFKIYFVSTLLYTNDPGINPKSPDMWKEGLNETVWPCIKNKISYIADSKSGIVTSPGYPNKYPSYANCIWEIIVPDGTELNLIFLSFNTERMYSNLYVVCICFLNYCSKCFCALLLINFYICIEQFTMLGSLKN